jgi:hypothetical protein
MSTLLHATGTFEVTMAPLGPDDRADGSTLGRLSLEKTFHGSLDGSSKGAMMTAMTGVEGSAGYVAIERFVGTLDGRRGSFVLQHGGVMTRGVPQLTILVVPDSATGALAGLTGRMAIVITEGVHSYDLQYSLPEAPP